MMNQTKLRFSLLLLALPLALVHCGDNKSEVKAPSTSSSDQAPTTSAATPTPSADPVASSSSSPEEPKKPRKPFEIYSNCSDVVTVVFGENAKDPKAGKKTIAPSSGIDGPRDNDGNQT